jgi:segregation and condensation protein A
LAELEKPFWLHPPYVILFDLLRLHRLKPWDVNVTYLLNNFLAEMKKQGYIDFSASGTALLSSAFIHRMKSELVLKMEEPPKPPQPKPQEVIPPPLPIPIRFEYTSTSVVEVLKALEEVLRSERSLLSAQKSPLKAAQVIEQLDEFLTNIEDHINEFFSMLVQLSKKRKSISFRRLVRGLSLQEIVRDFVMMLFLAGQAKIRIYQEEEFSDITISVVEAMPTVTTD